MAKDAKSAKKETPKTVNLRKLKPGDRFAYKNVGYGYTTYEEGSDVIGVKKGVLFTHTFDKMGMMWNGETWQFDSGSGLVTSVVRIEDVPAGQL